MATKVLIARRIPQNGIKLLREAGHDPVMLDADEPPSRPMLLREIRGAAGFISTFTERVDDEFLDAAGPELRVVANFAVGFDNIDVPACRRRGIRVTNTPGVLTEATADLTLALILAVARRVVEGDMLVRTGRWTGWTPNQLLGMELSGATLGIVGAGRIGTAAARRAVGFGMRILYAHPRQNPELEAISGARRVELDALMADADIISLHVPMREENRHLIDKRRMLLMKRGAILVNTTRGAVVDERALLEILREGRISAGLDVYENEPRVTPGLADLPNVVLLPHLGSGTTQTRERMSRMVAENVIAALTGREPPNAVDR